MIDRIPPCGHAWVLTRACVSLVLKQARVARQGVKVCQVFVCDHARKHAGRCVRAFTRMSKFSQSSNLAVTDPSSSYSACPFSLSVNESNGVFFLDAVRLFFLLVSRLFHKKDTRHTFTQI